jgi:hypothetical protein
MKLQKPLPPTKRPLHRKSSIPIALQAPRTPACVCRLPAPQGRWLSQPSCRIGKTHPDCQRIRHLPFDTDDGGFPVNDRAGLKIRALVGVATAPDARDMGGQAVDLLVKGKRCVGVR